MINPFSLILKWLTGGTLDRILSTVDHKVDNATERERIKTQAVETYISAQAKVLSGRGWWFPLLFLVPFGLWFSSVCIYSMLWCSDCIFPQPWTIAALPSPLNGWAGVMISSLFISKVGGDLLARLRK